MVAASHPHRAGAAIATAAIVALLVGCSPGQTRKDGDRPGAAAGASPPGAQQFKHIREPAVAGDEQHGFYPDDPAKLAAVIQQCLDGAHYQQFEHLRGLVCPHAGYLFSGPVAGSAFKLLLGRSYKTVIIMGPSHHAAFQGIFLTPHDAWRTPLGTVGVSAKAARLADNPLFKATNVHVFQPNGLPGFSTDTPETYEHSVEVEVPFLQKTLTNFDILPLVFGEADTAEAAKAIADLIDDSTLLIASSDLSHYRTYDQAQKIDQRSVEAICDLRADDVETNSELGGPCGVRPIRTLIRLAKMKGWKAKRLDLRNSGDTYPAGGKDRVVGYSAIAFYDGPEPVHVYNHDERRLLLDLARKTVAATADNQPIPEPDTAAFPDKLKEKKGAFVTLTINGQLRGCIGQIVAQEPLCQSVRDMAQSAAKSDPRFPSVAPSELAKIRIEVSVLGEPQPLAFSSAEDLLAKLRPNVDGVILSVGQSHQGLFLPQVWEQIPDKVTFMNELASQKAHLAPDAWRDPRSAVINTFQVEAFDESEK